MYKECNTCKHLGEICQGPNFAALDAAEVVAWCKARKNHLGLSNGKLAEMSGLPKGTIDGLFSSTHTDFRYETIRPVINALIGGEWSGPPCQAQGTPREIERLKERVRHLEAELQLKQESIEALREDRNMRRDDMQAMNEQQERNDSLVHKEIKRKNRTITILSVIVAILLAVIIAALVVDYMNTHIGFFWLESLLHPQGDKLIKTIKGSL